MKRAIFFRCMLLGVLLLFSKSAELRASVDFNLVDSDVKIDGDSLASPGTGYRIASLGDINGDGIKDFAIAGSQITGTSQRFYSYRRVGIFFGKTRTNPWPRTLALGNADVILAGSDYFLGRTDPPADNVDDEFGTRITSGDVNGDGINDILIGAPGRQRAFLFMGRSSWPRGLFFDGADVTFMGMTGSASIGNFNGDRSSRGNFLNDIVIGDPSYRNAMGVQVGRTYLFLGRESGWPRTINASDAHAYWSPESWRRSGYSCFFVGYLNEDPRHDSPLYEELVIADHDAVCGPRCTYINGQVNLFEGNPEGTLTPAATWRHRLSDPFGSAWYGRECAKVGDVNNDGFEDFVAGDSRNVDLVLGRPGHLTDLRPATTFSYSTEVSYGGGQYVHLQSMSGIADPDADGINDVLLGGIHNSATAFLLRGRMWGWGMDFNPFMNYDVKFVGEESTDSSDGITISFVGDVNGGGQGDILIGIPGHVSNGRVYLIFGETLFPPSPFIPFPSFPWIIYYRPLIFPDDIDPRPWPLEGGKFAPPIPLYDPAPDVMKTDDAQIVQKSEQDVVVIQKEAQAK